MNPYRKIRMDAHQSQKEVANQINVTPQVILRVEQGLFSSPPPDLTAYLTNLYNHTVIPSNHTSNVAVAADPDVNPEGTLPLSPSTLQRQYFRWVYATRNANKRSSSAKRIQEYFQYWSRSTSARVSWKEFRKNILGLSVAGTAKLLVLQISLIQDLEKTGRNAAQVQDILLDWGVPLEAINYVPANRIVRNNVTELA